MDMPEFVFETEVGTQTAVVDGLVGKPYPDDLDNEDLEFVVGRLTKREGMDETLARRILPEYKRYMKLRKISREVLSPSVPVDEFWHAHVLYTEQYAEFCQRNFGKFIHHRPFDHSPVPIDGVVIGERTRQLIEEHFPEHDAGIWQQTAMCSSYSTDG